MQIKLILTRKIKKGSTPSYLHSLSEHNQDSNSSTSYADR